MRTPARNQEYHGYHETDTRFNHRLLVPNVSVQVQIPVATSLKIAVSWDFPLRERIHIEKQNQDGKPVLILTSEDIRAPYRIKVQIQNMSKVALDIKVENTMKAITVLAARCFALRKRPYLSISISSHKVGQMSYSGSRSTKMSVQPTCSKSRSRRKITTTSCSWSLSQRLVASMSWY